MALSRVKTWVDGEVLFSADQNGEFNNILNNPIALISPTTGAINFNGLAHSGLVPSAVTASSGSTGQPLGVLPSGTVGFINVGTAVSRVSGLVATLSSQSGTFAADGFVMRSTASALTWSVTATSSFGASVGTAGPAAGGRDVAAAFSSTEVHWYAITTGPGSTAPACVVSSKAPPLGPVMPATYTGWTYLGGSPYSSASTTVSVPHRMRGAKTYYDALAGVLSVGHSTAEVTLSLANAVPANATEMLIYYDVSTTAAANGVARLRLITGSDYIIGVTGPTVNDRDTGLFSIPNIGRNLIYTVDSTFTGLTINAQGYTMPNGDV